ncbi:MAG: hypothetical protein WBO44_12695 [Saprospiraceae bacterium]
MLIDILQLKVSGDQKGWLFNGKILNPYQKKVLNDAGISTRKWTELLYFDESPTFTDLIKVCNIVKINIEDVVEHYQ